MTANPRPSGRGRIPRPERNCHEAPFNFFRRSNCEPFPVRASERAPGGATGMQNDPKRSVSRRLRRTAAPAAGFLPAQMQAVCAQSQRRATCGQRAGRHGVLRLGQKTDPAARQGSAGGSKRDNPCAELTQITLASRPVFGYNRPAPNKKRQRQPCDGKKSFVTAVFSRSLI